MAGSNVQSAVDTETHLIVAHDVTNQVHDRDLLSPMAKATKTALHRDELHALADKGYFSGREILSCHKAGIITTIPRPETSGNRAKGMYVKADFAYEPTTDTYRCPAGEALRICTSGLLFRRRRSVSRGRRVINSRPEGGRRERPNTGDRREAQTRVIPKPRLITCGNPV